MPETVNLDDVRMQRPTEAQLVEMRRIADHLGALVDKAVKDTCYRFANEPGMTIVVLLNAVVNGLSVGLVASALSMQELSTQAHDKTMANLLATVKMHYEHMAAEEHRDAVLAEMLKASTEGATKQ